MADPSLFNILFEAWRQAEKAAFIAERQWAHALERSHADPQEAPLRMVELIAARQASSSLLKQALGAARYRFD